MAFCRRALVSARITARIRVRRACLTLKLLGAQDIFYWLKDNITDKFYSFDAALLPDGGYTMRVVASDAPSHSPEEAQTSARESQRFEIDTTPPQVVNLNAY